MSILWWLLCASITIDITVTFRFNSFFCSLARSRHLSLFSLAFIFPQWSAGTTKSTIRWVIFFCFNWLSLGLVVWSRLGDIFVSQNYYYYYLLLYYLIPDIGLGVRVFANGPGDLGSIPGRFIPKTQKMVLDASLLNTQHYKVRIKGKVEQSREGVAPSPTPWCSSYRIGSLRVTLDCGRQLYFTYLFTPWEFSTSVLADSLPLESEWQQVSSSLQDSSQYSGLSQ